MSAGPTDPDPDERLLVSSRYLIEDHQVWGSVLVNPSGRLIVANGGHLETGNIELRVGSIFEARSGRITIENHT
ncbi:MAG: hypothetical protein LN414_08180, partial [Candidatus Thermoplasmatota archaeon]|nr:hypothetical protein [Candidatus Thermoplasmatota archaeon]